MKNDSDQYFYDKQFRKKLCTAIREDGNSSQFLRLIISLADKSEGVRDLLLLWYNETDREYKKEILKDLYDSILDRITVEDLFAVRDAPSLYSVKPLSDCPIYNIVDGQYVFAGRESINFFSNIYKLVNGKFTIEQWSELYNIPVEILQQGCDLVAGPLSDEYQKWVNDNDQSPEEF
jgi:hypothetical protein